MLRKILINAQTKTFGRRCVSSLVDLTGVHQHIQESCRDFAEKELRPMAGKYDKECLFPHEHIKTLAEIGLMGVTVPELHGGSGLDTLSLSIAIEELSRGCAATGLIVSIHNSLCVNLLHRMGYYEPLESLCTGGVGFFALSEANAGSDVANISMHAELVGDEWILNGTKAWVTSAQEAEGGVVFATTDRNLGHRGITAFYVRTDAQGVEVGPSEDKLGVKGTSTCNLYLNEVKAHPIGVPGEGFKIALTQLDQGRIGIASQALGIAQAALDEAISYASQRVAFGQLLIEMSSVKNRLAEMTISLESARILTRTAAVKYEAQGWATKYSSMAKLASSQAATFCAHNCIAIMGGMGVVTSTPAERHYRDARMTEVYGGITDIQKLTVADQLIREYRR